MKEILITIEEALQEKGFRISGFKPDEYSGAMFMYATKNGETNQIQVHDHGSKIKTDKLAEESLSPA